jgi:hypothetical protein
MADDAKQQNINFGIDPNKTKILYIDSYLISNNEHVVTFNFAQALPDPAQHNIVSRVALTKNQAKDFLKHLNEHIEKFEV